MPVTMMMRLVRIRIVVVGAACPKNQAAHAKKRKEAVDKPQPENMATFEFLERARQLCRRGRLRAAQALETPVVKCRLVFIPFPCVVHRRKVPSVQSMTGGTAERLHCFWNGATAACITGVHDDCAAIQSVGIFSRRASAQVLETM